MEGERQVRRGADEASPAIAEALRGLRSSARVEAEPVELPADLLILGREVPALVGGGIESPEVRFV